jgi:lipopolysaccharide transport system ATP-binding protein
MGASDLAISVRNVGKQYIIAHEEKHATLAEKCLAVARNPLKRAPLETFDALRDVSFDIHKGDVVGIIGRNGAGKSTLLKILSRITEPTTGQIDLYGRVGSLLEVGTGFHPELTGRENIYLNGAILGMKKKEIERQFEAIVAFAEVDKFLDTPVKRYSSGMYVRLAFAVAAHLNPEILIVDEVLAVGDTQFQSKCLGKMKEVSQGQGRTVLFVSHNMAAVKQLCRSGLLLRNGEVVLRGTAADVTAAYLQSGAEFSGERTWAADKAPGTSKCRLRAVRIVGPDGGVVDEIGMTKPFAIEVEYECRAPLPSMRVALRVLTNDGTVVFTATDSRAEAARARGETGSYTTVCVIPADTLNAGQYALTVSADVPFVETLFYQEAVVRFAMVHTAGVDGLPPERWEGLMRPSLEWWVVPTGSAEKRVLERPGQAAELGH